MGRIFIHKTEAELAELLAEGNERAFEEIYKRFHPLLYRHAVGMLRGFHLDEITKDVLQDTFFHIWEKHNEINIRRSLSGYLYGTLRNKILDRIKHSKFRDNYLNSLEKALDRVENTTENTIIENELRQKIESEIERLPERMKEAFRLSLSGEYTIAEQAKLLNCKEQTIKMYRHRALEKIRLKISHFLFCLF